MKRIRAIVNRSQMSILAGLLLAAAVSSQAVAQSQCAGALSTDTDPDTFTQPLAFTGYPGFGEIVRVTLTPGAGANSADLTLDEVEYALACTNNQDEVPCANGNDQGASSGDVPVEFVGNVDGDCGVTNANVSLNPADLGAGTVRFEFPAPLTFEAGQGCSINFDVRVRDQGTDASPLNLTGAAQASGTCAGGKLVGTGRGSVSIFLEDAPPPPPPLSVPGPQGWWLVVMAMMLLIPAVSRVGRFSP